MSTVESNHEIRLGGSRRVVWVFSILLAVVVILGWKFWLFRKVTIANEALGKVTYIWKWGRPYGINIDFNLDGEPDEVYHLLPGAKGFFTDVPFDEGWLDADYDGIFEVHIDYGSKDSLIVDAQDPDGAKRFFQGSDAKAFLDQIRATRIKQAARR